MCNHLCMETKTLYVRIQPDLHRAVLLAAHESRRKIAAQVEVIIEDWLSLQPANSVRDLPAVPNADNILAGTSANGAQ